MLLHQIDRMFRHQIDAPLEMSNVHLDIVQNHSRATLARFCRVLAVLFSRPLYRQHGDPSCDSTKLQHFLRWRLPRNERHLLGKLSDRRNVFGVGLRTLHRCPGEILHRARVRHHNFRRFTRVERQGDVEAVDSRRFEHHTKTLAVLLQPPQQAIVTCRVLRTLFDQKLLAHDFDGYVEGFYAYVDANDHFCDVGRKHPPDDGVFIVDVATGEKRLMALFQQIRDLFINHTLWSRDGEWFFFFARADLSTRKKRLNTPFVVCADGTGLKSLAHYFGGHPEWAEGSRMIGRRGAAQAIYDVEREEFVGTLGEPSSFPNPEGDIALSPEGAWLVNG